MSRRFKHRTFYVYILGSSTGVLYIGVTNDLERRVAEHKEGDVKGFTSRYGVKRLLYFEEFASPSSAIAREKEIKGWLRERKLALIRSMNPRFVDLSETTAD